MKRRDKAGMAWTAIFILVVLSPFLADAAYSLYPKAETKLLTFLNCHGLSLAPGDGAASADVQAWNDLDADGIRNQGEPALSGAIVEIVPSGYVYRPQDVSAARDWLAQLENVGILGPEVQLTNEHGGAAVSTFRPGCACACWGGYAVAAWPPDGYELTTPSMVGLTSNEDVVTFGFRKIVP